MSPSILRPDKSHRARVIAAYVADAGIRGVVCFSCGHASAALAGAGLYVVDISPTGGLHATRWWSPAAIHRVWPDLFDATCGHLPMPMMAELATVYRGLYADTVRTGGAYTVPTGSGETFLCLSWAFPECVFHPAWGFDPATAFHKEAPLAAIVGPYCRAATAEAIA